GSEILYAGYANGDVIAIYSKSWRQETLLRGYGAIQDIVMTDDGRTLAVATNDGTIHVGTRGDDASSRGAVNWVTLLTRAKDLALAAAGLLTAAGTDGTIWLYSVPGRHWVCLPTGTVDLTKITMTTNGKAAVSSDRGGRLLWIDLDATRKLLGMTS